MYHSIVGGTPPPPALRNPVGDPGWNRLHPGLGCVETGRLGRGQYASQSAAEPGRSLQYLVTNLMARVCGGVQLQLEEVAPAFGMRMSVMGGLQLGWAASASRIIWFRNSRFSARVWSNPPGFQPGSASTPAPSPVGSLDKKGIWCSPSLAEGIFDQRRDRAGLSEHGLRPLVHHVGLVGVVLPEASERSRQSGP